MVCDTDRGDRGGEKSQRTDTPQQKNKNKNTEEREKRKKSREEEHDDDDAAVGAADTATTPQKCRCDHKRRKIGIMKLCLARPKYLTKKESKNRKQEHFLTTRF